MKTFIIKLGLILLSINAFSQVGINTTTPDASSMLEISSNSKGVLIPRMTQAERDAIASPATGLLIYQVNNTSGFYYFDGSTWQLLSNASTNIERINDLTDGKTDIYGNTSVSGSTFLGYESGLADDGANKNTALGYQSMKSLTTGRYNVSLGFKSLFGNSATGNNNIAVGYETLFFNTSGYDNQAIGFQGLYNNTTGYGNLSMGTKSLYSNTSGYYNVALGLEAMNKNISGHTNTAVGQNSLNLNTSGSLNTAIGTKAMQNNTTGYRNTAIGMQSLQFNSTGFNNTAVGCNALQDNTGTNNVAVGFEAGSNNTGYRNVFLGAYAGSNYLGNDKLFIENSIANPSNALIYGEFGTDSSTLGNILRTNSEFQIGDPSITGYKFPKTRGVANEILQLDGSGQLSFVNPNSLGIEDADFYKENTTSSPTNISDDIYTLGNVAIGKNTADYPLEISTQNDRAIFSTIDGTSDSIIKGIFQHTANSGNGFHYGFYNVLSGSGSGKHFGTFNILSGTGTGKLYGTRQEITNSGNNDHHGCYNILWGSGSGTHVGTYNRLSGTGSGSQYAIYQEIDNSGDGIHIGFYNRLISGGSGNKYGILTSIPTSAGGVHYGIFSDAEGETNFAGFFKGNVKVTNKIMAPTSGSADLKPYIYGSLKDTDGSYYPTESTGGFTSTRESQGVYRITFNNYNSDKNYLVIASALRVGSPVILTYEKNVGFFRVRAWNLSGNLTDTYFNFVVYKR